MRIVKQQACAVLKREIASLERQCERCQRQAAKFSGLCMDGLSGRGVTAAEQRMRMQSAIALAHQTFFRSLLAADRSNMQMISGLPTTSPGVLDTSVAQRRIDEARTTIASLEVRMAEALERAHRVNELDEGSPTVDCDGIRYLFESLISAQRAVITHNEDILTRARAYERKSLGTYQAVSCDVMRSAATSAGSFVATGSWGDTTWAGRLFLGRALEAELARQAYDAAHPSTLDRFLRGDLKAQGSVWSGSTSSSGYVMGVMGTGTLGASLLSCQASLAPYGKGDSSQKDSDKSVGMGVEATIGGSLAQLTATTDYGLLHTSNKTSLLSGSATGKLGAALKLDGPRIPTAEAKAGVSASVLSTDEEVRLGLEDLNVHTRAKADVGTHKSEAGVKVGIDGVEASVGSETYLAKGELATGFTLLGVRIERTHEAAIGGKGAAASGAITTDGIEGSLSAGLGVGTGVKVKVDWSGLRKALGRMDATVEEVARLLGVPMADAA